MYIFMYLIYIMSITSLAGLTLVGLGGFLHRGFLGMNHPTLALLVSVIFLATETLVMFFFVGTGVSIKEYIHDHAGVDHDFHRRSVAIKRVLYPPTLNVTLVVMVTFVIGGAVDRHLISHWWHLAGWIISMWLFLRALRVQHRALRDNTAIILEMVGLSGPTGDTPSESADPESS